MFTNVLSGDSCIYAWGGMKAGRALALLSPLPMLSPRGGAFLVGTLNRLVICGISLPELQRGTPLHLRVEYVVI